MSWLKKYLNEIWNDSEVQQPAKKAKWKLHQGVYPVCRRIFSKRKYTAIIPSKKSIEEKLKNLGDFERFD